MCGAGSRGCAFVGLLSGVVWLGGTVGAVGDSVLVSVVNGVFYGCWWGWCRRVG